ncbi:hypothetical protein [Xanthomonas phaseoli]|nr:hypothetical protein [Xanthomonas phaseoli]
MNESVLRMAFMPERSGVDARAQPTRCACRIHLYDVDEGVQ